MAKRNQSSSEIREQRLHENLRSERQKKDREKIVEFFLNLYNVQLKGWEKAPKQHRFLNQSRDAGYTYELKVRHYGKWVSRPMGIAPIGEEGGSKSTCYKVTYDDVLVVKIPRRPITDLDEYIKSLKTERQIAARLMPQIECIAPGVSPILKKVPPFIKDMCWVPEEVEEKSIERLRQFKKFQQYLKIGDSFVFFMDISKFSFLVQVMSQMFDVSEKIRLEITRLPEIISNFQRFEERYGIENAGIWLNVNRIFKEYENQIETALIDKGLASQVPSFKRRAWFLNYLADDEIPEQDNGHLADALPEFDQLISGLMSRYRADIFSYKKMVREFIEQKSFSQSQSRIACLIGSILRLLANLNGKKVAIRDLKPDNIFVTGDSSSLDIALSCDQGVELGLIDFETAVALDVSSIKRLEQPLIGGTPSYATPSNFVPNFVLETVYDDVPRILHLQDWHACLCMIFVGATGEYLFSKSRNFLYEIIKAVQRPDRNHSSMEEGFKSGSFLFWNAAEDEYRMRMENKKALLESIEIKIPPKTREMIKSESAETAELLSRTIRDKLANQRMFKSRKSISNLRQSTPEMIASYRQRWEKGINLPKTTPRLRKRIINFLHEIEMLKKEAKALELLGQRCEDRLLVMTAYKILWLMFTVVFYNMYKPRWETELLGDDLNLPEKPAVEVR